MQNQTEHQPGDPAPDHGQYEALNVFGTGTGTTVDAVAGEPLPALPRGFTWRRIAPPEC